MNLLRPRREKLHKLLLNLAFIFMPLVTIGYASLQTALNVNADITNGVYSTLMEHDDVTTTTFGKEIARSSFESITIVDDIVIPLNAIDSWDVSDNHSGLVMAWYTDVDNDNQYELYIGQYAGVIANTNSQSAFSNFVNVTEINLNGFITSEVENMNSMFYKAGFNSPSFVINDLDLFNTSNVTNMFRMFYQAGNNATNFDISGVSEFDTSSVNIMSQMFYSAGSHATNFNIDLSEWETGEVISMSNMFQYSGYYSSTWSIGDLSEWDTSNVISMNNMFNGAGYSAAEFDMDYFGEWDTENVTNMNSMFYDCAKVKKLDISSFDMSGATDVTNMLGNMSSLKELVTPDVYPNSTIILTNTMYDSSMNSYSSLTSSSPTQTLLKAAYTVSFDKTSGTGTMNDQLILCNTATNLNANTFTKVGYYFKEWNTYSNGAGDTYANQASVTNLGAPGSTVHLYAMWEEDAAYFAGSYSNSIFANVTDVTNITAVEKFTGSSSVVQTLINNNTAVRIDNGATERKIYAWNDNGTIYWWTDAYTVYMNDYAHLLFSGLTNATSIDVSGINTSKVTNMSGAFGNTGQNATELTITGLDTWNTSSVTNMNRMFNNVSSVKNLDLSSFDMSSVTNVDYMLNGINSLVTLKTPSTYSSLNVTLPKTMYDSSRNAYTVIGSGTPTNTMLYAGYTISFNANGGSGGQSSDVVGIYSLSMPTISTTTPTKEGYTFQGWYDNATGGTQYYTAAGGSARTWDKTNNTTLYAQWSINNPTTPTITGGATKVYNYEDTTLTCASSTTYATGANKYYEFGYSTTSGGTVTWLGSPSTTATLSIGKAAYLGTRYYTCRVYASDGTLTSNTSTASTTTTMTLQRVKIIFNATTNSGTLSGTSPLYVQYGSGTLYTTADGSTTSSMPTASRTNYNWNGWYTAASSGSQVANTTPALTGTAVTNWTNANKQWIITTTSDKTLYATYTIKSYTVTAYANNGSISSTSGWTGTGSSATKSFTHGSTLTFPTVSRSGYILKGWYTAASGGTQVTTSTTVTAARSIYAQWNEDAAYFAGDGSTSYLANVTSLDNITTFVKSTASASTVQTYVSNGTAIKIDDGTTTRNIYAWYSSGTLYWWTDAATVYMNNNSHCLLRGLKYATSVSLAGINTSKVTDMSNMFRATGDLATSFSLNISNIDSSNVTDMNHMFASTGRNATSFSLNVSYLNTAKVTDMSYMFSYAGFLSTSWSVTGLTGLNTSSVQNMDSMLNGIAYNSTSAFSLNLSSWTVTNVTNMSNLFRMAAYNASSVTLNLSNWNTTKVTKMGYMFASLGYNTTSLSITGLSNFVTTNVTDMNHMFYQTGRGVTGTWSVGTINGWNVAKVTDMSYMFGEAGYNSSSITLNLSGWTVSAVKNMSYMFSYVGSNSSSVTISGLANWNVSAVTNMSGMFISLGESASTVSIGTLTNWTVTNVTDMSYMFSGMGKNNLSTFNIGTLTSWNTAKVTNMSFMFSNTATNATWSTLGTLKVYATNIQGIFNWATGVKVTMNIYSNPTTYSSAFFNSAYMNSASVVVNYKSTTTNIDSIIATKSSWSNVTKGSVLS